MIIVAKCLAHPHYKATRCPDTFSESRVNCKGCWALWEIAVEIRNKIKGVGGYSHDAIGSLDYKLHTLEVK